MRNLKSRVLIAVKKTGNEEHMAQDIADWADVNLNSEGLAHCYCLQSRKAFKFNLQGLELLCALSVA